MKKILIVYYSLGGNTKSAAEYVAEGVAKGGAEPVVKTGTEATPEDLVSCDGIIVGSPDYFGYMAGGLKDFFDRSWFPAREKVNGMPYAVFITCGGNGEAIGNVVKICRRFKFIKAAQPVIIKRKPMGRDIEKLITLGQTLTGKVNANNYHPGEKPLSGHKYLNFLHNRLKWLRSIRYRF